MYIHIYMYVCVFVYICVEYKSYMWGLASLKLGQASRLQFR